MKVRALWYFKRGCEFWHTLLKSVAVEWLKIFIIKHLAMCSFFSIFEPWKNDGIGIQKGFKKPSEMCYNFATFVLYLDVITLIYRENRLTSSETSLSAFLTEHFNEISSNHSPRMCQQTYPRFFCLSRKSCRFGLFRVSSQFMGMPRQWFLYIMTNNL